MFEVLLQTLRSDSSLVVNKALARNIGLDCAIIYCELLSRYCYFREREMLSEDDSFFNTIEDLQEATTLSPYQQRTAISKLENLGLIELKLKGIPAKRYFHLIQDVEILTRLLLQNDEALNNKMLKNLTTCCEETSQPVVKKLQSNNINNNTKNNTKTLKGFSAEILPEQDAGTEIEKPAKPKKPKRTQAEFAKDHEEMLAMIDAFTKNEDVKAKLMEYYMIRKNKGLKPNQWQIILSDLREFAGDTASAAISKINTAIAGGYMQIIASWEKNKKYAATKPKFDNTATKSKPVAVVTMTPEEQKQFESELATDESGQPLKF